MIAFFQWTCCKCISILWFFCTLQYLDVSRLPTWTSVSDSPWDWSFPSWLPASVPYKRHSSWPGSMQPISSTATCLPGPSRKWRELTRRCTRKWTRGCPRTRSRKSFLKMTINIMVGEVDIEKHKQRLREFDGLGLFWDSIDLLKKKSSI